MLEKLKPQPRPSVLNPPLTLKERKAIAYYLWSTDMRLKTTFVWP